MPAKRKRRFPYRKVEDLEADIAREETQLRELEQLLASQPDFIITIDPTFYAAIWHDAAWQQIAAVRSKHVYLAPALPFGQGADSLDLIDSTLHPV